MIESKWMIDEECPPTSRLPTRSTTSSPPFCSPPRSPLNGLAMAGPFPSPHQSSRPTGFTAEAEDEVFSSKDALPSISPLDLTVPAQADTRCESHDRLVAHGHVKKSGRSGVDSERGGAGDFALSALVLASSAHLREDRKGI